MDKDHVTALQPCGAGVEKVAMRLWDSLDRLGMHRGKGAIHGVPHPV